MRFKLDENLDERLSDLFEQHGHEATTVYGEGMRGESDRKLFELCRREDRIMVSQDLGFSNVLRFPPEVTPGIVVLRGKNQLLPTLRHMVELLLEALKDKSPRGKLWVVGANRVRVYPSLDEQK